jgi:Ribonuclease G/E
MSTEEHEPGSESPASNDGVSREAPSGGEGRPRRKRARRRGTAPRAPREAAAAEEAGAFLDPPPVAQQPPASDVPPAGGESSGEGADKPRRGRGRATSPKTTSGRKKSARKKARRRRGGASTSEDDDNAGPAAAQGPSDGSEPAAEGERTDSAPKRKRRRRSRRGRGDDESGRRAEAPRDGDRDALSFEEAGADEPAPDPEGAVPDRKRRGRRKSEKPSEKKKPERRSADSKQRKGDEGEGKKGDRKKGERKKGERKKRGERKSEGRSRSEGRGRSEGRRDGRGRDPRAIDIVPRAPSPEEAAKEKVLLVNAADQAEARIALLVDGVLEEIYVESATVTRSAAGNIYRGRVQNVERGIGAAFVDLGRSTTGFLHATDLPRKEGDEPGQGVTDRLSPGDEVIVQITRDSIGRKGPALTGRISFPGRYLVLMPFTARSGISRRIPHGPDRDHVRKLLKKLDVPEGMGVIVRTASEATDLAALKADLDHLLRNWEFIKRKAAEPGQPGLLRSESDLAERSVRDIMPGDVTRIVVDKEELAGQIHRLLRVWYPSAAAAAEEAAHEAVRSVTASLDTPLGELRSLEEQAAAASAEAVDEAAEKLPPEPEQAESVDPSAAARALLSEEAAADEEPPPLPGEAGEISEADAEAEAITEEEEPAPLVPIDPEESKAERLARLRRMARTMPEVELHTDAVPLFHQYGVETQLEDAFRRSIRLPSGGSIVIDPTEALVAVDVNSGRLTDEEDPESTALVTNLEAVVEAARQLRVRDLGGLVVIDFIDMRDRRSRKQVESALRDALSGDRARIRMGRMGPFGLVVLSRQRIRQALSRVTHEMCALCGGTGHRRQVSGLGLRILREMKARIARSRGRGGLEVRAPQEVVGWMKKHVSLELKALRKTCTGPLNLLVDPRLASDGWAMKGTPPEGEA